MRRYAFVTLILALLMGNDALCAARLQDDSKLRQTPYPKSELNLKEFPFRIVYETYRKTDGKENWELYLINADGSNPVNLTNTPDVDELYPHASADGGRICFVADEGIGRKKVRNVYYINIDRLTKKLTPKFIFANACMPWAYKKAEKFLRILCKTELVTVYVTRLINISLQARYFPAIMI